MSKKKIYILSPAYPFRGGMVQFASILHQKLKELGHKSKIISYVKQFPDWLFPGETQMDSSENFLEVEESRVFAPLSPLTWFKTYKVVKNEKPDSIIFNWWIPFFAPSYFCVAFLIRKFTETEIVFLVHNAIPHEKWPFMKFLTKMAFSQADKFLLLSEAVANDLKQIYPKVKESQLLKSKHPIYDFYLSEKVESSKEELKESLGIKTSRVILFFGFIKKYKGLNTLLKAMPKVIEYFKGDLTLLIVGEFYYSKSNYNDLVKKLGIAENIKLVDSYVSNEDVYKYFTPSDAVILPYTSATQSGIIQIAFGFEKPIIASRIGGIPEVVKENEIGLLAEPKSPDDFAEKIISFYEEELEAKFSTKIKEEKKKYSWEKLVEDVENSLN